jgi:hypothetical protein
VIRDEEVPKVTWRWPRVILSLLVTVAILLSGAAPAAASNYESATAAACTIYDPTYYWLCCSGTGIHWNVSQTCNQSLPNQYANGEVRRQTGWWWWEWSTFDTCNTGTVANQPSVSCTKDSTTVQEYTRDHEIKNNYFLQAPPGQVWQATNTAVRYGTIVTPHFKY